MTASIGVWEALLWGDSAGGRDGRWPIRVAILDELRRHGPSPAGSLIDALAGCEGYRREDIALGMADLAVRGEIALTGDRWSLARRKHAVRRTG